MPLTPEDGSGLAAADSYCSAAEAAAHHASVGQADAWDAIDDKDAAIRLATKYLTQAYAGRWAGMRATSTQALDWPRSGVPWADSPLKWRSAVAVPPELKEASAELALRTASGPLLADLGRETLSVTVDVISTTYAEGRSRQTKFEAVDSLLRPLLKTGGASIPLVRS